MRALLHNNAIETTLRQPIAEDGAAVHKLISECPPLDTNSMYCNLLQCAHFSATSVAAEMNGELVGFISGYIEPEQAETLFIWQVAVGEKARGQGLASQMLEDILQRSTCSNVRFIETTITPDNRASWALFEKLAKKHDTSLTHDVMFDKNSHFSGQHETEMLVRIGPFK